MKFDGLLMRLLLMVGVVVSLGLSYATSRAQDMPPLLPAPVALQPVTPQQQTVTPQVTPQKLAEATTPPAPANPPTAAAPANPPTAVEPPAQGTAPATPTSASLTQAQLGQLLAPIALYPDQLLGQILMAVTYPVEIVEAARWVAEPAHRGLKGDALTNALRDQHWDPSVMALVPFPHVLEMMNAQLEWTQRLGAAFVAQQADVMNEVQQLRHQAMAAGRFNSGPQCQCVVAESGGYVTVAPANPEVVHVPVYAPAIYGPWLYPAYPPFLFPLPVGFAFAPGSLIGFGWGVNVAFYGPLWGWGSLDWGRHGIIVDPVRFAAISGRQAGFAGGIWVHDSTRGGIASARAATGWRAGVAGSGATATSTGMRAGVAGGRSTVAWTGGHAAWAGGHMGHAAWTGGHGGRFAAAAPGRTIRGGGGHVHMAAGGGSGHGGWGHGGGGHGNHR